MFNADSHAGTESETVAVALSDVDAGKEHSGSPQVTNQDSPQHHTEGPGASQFIAPVNLLPDEILTRILGYATAPSGHPWLLRTAGVCRHWKEIIEDTPLLWNDINLLMDIPMIDLALARSRDSDLVVSLDPSSYFSRGCTMLRSCIEPHRSRIACLVLYLRMFRPAWRFVRADPSGLLRMAEDSLPRLKSMAISVPTEHSVGLHLTQNNLPNIRHLSLSGVILHWDSWPLPHLSYLRLADVVHRRTENHDGGDLASVLDALQACPFLENFVYKCTMDPDTSASQGQSGITNRPTIRLPAAQLFHVTSTRPADIRVLLEHASLQPNACIKVYARNYSKRRSHADMMSSFVDIMGEMACKSVLQHVRSGSILFRDAIEEKAPSGWIHPAVYRVFGDPLAKQRFGNPHRMNASEATSNGEAAIRRPLLDMSCGISQGTPPSHGLYDLVRQAGVIFPPSLEYLGVGGGSLSSIDAETWRDVFAAFPQLRTLQLGSTFAAMTSIASALKPVAGVVPLPRLYLLAMGLEDTGYLSDMAGLDELYDALLMRNEAGSRLHALRILGIRSCASDTDDDAVNERREKLGTVVDKLYWDVPFSLTHDTISPT